MTDSSLHTHPRMKKVLHGHDAVEARLRTAFDQETMHHAWLLSGPKGIGKATLAYDFARYVLAKQEDPERVSYQIEAGSHPSLMVLDIESEESSTKAITVDAVRRINDFLHLTPSNKSWRIVIIDSADDLNRNAANALLKMLEEPSAKVLFLLISHSSGKLLPTLKSRCRKLDIRALPEALIREVVGKELLPEIIAIAAGSPGRAMELASQEGEELYRQVKRFCSEGTKNEEFLKFSEPLISEKNRETYQLVKGLILDITAYAAISNASSSDAAEQAVVWQKLTELFDKEIRLNLDRKTVLMSAFAMIAGEA